MWRRPFLNDSRSFEIHTLAPNVALSVQRSVSTTAYDAPAIVPAMETKDVREKVEEGNLQISGEDISAVAFSSEIIEEENKNSGSGYVPMIASLVFIGTSAGAVYFIRQRKISPGLGSDFNILDE